MLSAILTRLCFYRNSDQWGATKKCIPFLKKLNNTLFSNNIKNQKMSKLKDF